MYVAAYLGPSQWVKQSFLKGFIQIKVGIPCFRVLVNCKRWRNLCMTLLQLIQALILWLPKRVGGGAFLVPAQPGQKLSVKWKYEHQCVSSHVWRASVLLQVWTGHLEILYGTLGKLLLCHFPLARGHGDDGLKARLESTKPPPLFGFRT